MDEKYSLRGLIEECSKLKNKFERLNLPVIKNNNIKIKFKQSNDYSNEIDILTKFPIQETDYINVSRFDLNLLNCKTIDKQIDNNPKNDRSIFFQLWLELSFDKELKFEPGDSIGCTCGNFDNEVAELINLLGLDDKKNNSIEIENHSKILHFPKSSTLYQLIKFCIEIRAIPKKVALFAFSSFCTDKVEKDCLLLLSSKEGTKLYDEYILEKHFGFLDLFRNFKTCKPDLETFLSNSINFVPRYYSVIECITLKSENSQDFKHKLKIAFKVTRLPAYYGRVSTQLFGIFTGKLNQLYENRKSTDLVNKMNGLSINYENLYVFKRKNLMFRLSEKVSMSNTIMVSIGTGITPFLSLMKQYEKFSPNENIKSDKKDSNFTTKINLEATNLFLIHGCKTENECLYFDQLNEFYRTGVLCHLQICYSHMNHNGVKHVQDYLINCKIIKQLLVQPNVNIYVCGDQSKFLKDVFNAFVRILDEPDAQIILKKMQKEKRYLEDKWL